jgi:hypothetical protein
MVTLFPLATRVQSMSYEIVSPKGGYRDSDTRTRSRSICQILYIIDLLRPSLSFFLIVQGLFSLFVSLFAPMVTQSNFVTYIKL